MADKYKYYEIQFKNPGDKDWYQLTTDADRAVAINHYNRLRKIGQRAKITEVRVEKAVIAKG